MDYRIHIPEPCYEDWNQMSVEDQGRHCAVCCKIVIDFTEWETSAIIDYLKIKNEERVCGRFNNKQLHQRENDVTPESKLEHIWFSNTSIMRKIWVLILVSFGLITTSCDDSSTGKVDNSNSPDSVSVKERPVLKGNKAQLVDSLINEGHIVGIVDRPEGRMVLVAPPPPPVKTKISFSPPTIKGKVKISVVNDTDSISN